MEKPAKLFGTNGIRGVPNEGLNSDLCLEMGRSIASFFDSGTIAIARDTRLSGDYIFSTVSAGLLSAGSSLVNVGVLPTPGLQMYCKTHKIPGVMITASHNPPQYNGIKVIEADGTEASRETEESLELLYYNRKFRVSDWKNLGVMSAEPEYYKSYVESMISSAGLNEKKIDLRIAFDAGNGASFLTTPLMLQRVGTTLTTLNCNPDGLFTSRNSEPKPENLKSLETLMKSGNFDIGIAHDGDADRCVFYDEKANFVEGNEILAIFAKYLCEKGDTVVTPISTSDALEEVCRLKGINLVRTKVGAPIVARTIIKEKASLGGEENGGIIFSKHQFCRDGGMTALLMISVMNKTGKRLSELTREIPKYFVMKRSVQRKTSWDAISKLLRGSDDILKTDETDGLKIWEKSGWVLIRPSGTEPIIRIYSNSRTLEDSEKLCKKYTELIGQLS